MNNTILQKSIVYSCKVVKNNYARWKKPLDFVNVSLLRSKISAALDYEFLLSL